MHCALALASAIACLVSTVAAGRESAPIFAFRYGSGACTETARLIVEVPGLVGSDLAHFTDLRAAHTGADHQWDETVEHVESVDYVLDGVVGSCADDGDTRIVLDRLATNLSPSDRIATLQRFDRELLQMLDQIASRKRSHALVLSSHPALHERMESRKRQLLYDMPTAGSASASSPLAAIDYIAAKSSSSSSASSSSSGNTMRQGDGILDVYSFISPILIVSLLLMFAFLVPLIVFGLSMLASIPLPYGLEHKSTGSIGASQERKDQ